MRESNSPGFRAAMEEAEAGAKEGGVPIGASLVAADGTILGRGHNMRIQRSSPTIHVRNQENKTFVGGEDVLEKNGVEVMVLDHARGKELMAKFIKDNPGEWNEDIGKE
ncbi:hypothetical protein BLS_004593 [Venturia inaequalis]|uniref:CMP/dCMP-type deaminase domain-containing protein n=1 Tax=Venturia inaequalis TaxID=5025 RepID=A0A8H3UKV3_VENIN|nr:hypothetical protein BLS_004593 [Venturia inaequalis]